MVTQNENSDPELDIALKSTNGDTGKALAMVAGEYFDCVALKSAFLLQDSGYSGLILIFFNTADDYVPYIDSVILKIPIVYGQIDVAIEWKAFLHELGMLKNSNDVINVPEINDKIVKEIFQANFFSDVKTGNLEHLKSGAEVILRKVLGNQPVSCILSAEQVSSLIMSKEGIPFEKPEQTNTKSEADNITHGIEEKAEFVLEGSAVIAPVKGKFIAKIQAGDEILILIPDKDQTTRNILTSLNAIDKDGTVSPVYGKVAEKINMPETRTVAIYALIAEGILVKLIEDNSLKIVDKSSMEGLSAKIELPSKAVLFIIAAVVIIVIILLV